MIHQFVIEQYISGDKWETIIDTREFLKQTYYKPPYLALQIQSQVGVSVQATLMIGNPDYKTIGSVYGAILRISIGYGYYKSDNQNAQTAIWQVFTGKAYQPPYFTEGGEGTDRILIINLTISGVGQNKVYGSGLTLDEVLKSVFKTPSGDAAQIEYEKEELASRILEGRLKTTSETTIGMVISFFKAEGYEITRDAISEKIFVKETKGAGSTANSKTKANVPVIYNSADASGVATLIKTKYAVLDLAQRVTLELAIVMPQLLTYDKCIINNIGTNIILYGGSEKETTRTFTIFKQEVFFSTWGDCTHKVQLQESRATSGEAK